MTNKQIARVLKETADLVELTGGNPYRARAFASAARTIERWEFPVERLAQAGTLTDMPGIGEGLAAQIDEILATGTFELREALLEELPAGLGEVLKVKGLGVKRVRRLWQDLGVTSLDDLEAAAGTGRLATLEGFGEKTAENVLENVRRLRVYRARRHYADAVVMARPLMDRLRMFDGVEAVEPTGELRRKLETVDGIDLIVATTRPEAIPTLLSAWHPQGRLRDDLFEADLDDGFRLRVHMAPPDRFGTAWWRTTGSPEHLRAFEAAHGVPADHADEADLFRAAGLEPIPPELREGTGELEAAAEAALPSLLTVRELRGTLHNHSTYSDGAHALRDMAEAARSMGLEYFGVCDHSQSLAIAHGLSPAEVARQQREIRHLNAGYQDQGIPFRIFSGIESDILADGSLDYPDEVLSTFDFVVASVHQGMDMSEKEATERVVKAVENPFTTILGHATGRLLLRREGYPLDHARVIEACAEHGVALEMNANPYRLDLDWRHIRRATERGVRIAINPDAHSTDELHNVLWGVEAARKGWLTAEQCLNALPLEDFEAWLDARRSVRS